MNATKSSKPAKVYDHKIGIPGGPTIECYQNLSETLKVAGAFMPLSPEKPDRLLSLVSSDPGSPGLIQNYMGYRDGVLNSADKLAVSVEDDGCVRIQFAFSETDIAYLSLDELGRAIRSYQKSRFDPTSGSLAELV